MQFTLWISNGVPAFTLAVLLALSSPSQASLQWRGQNLSALGIQKGRGLPTYFLYMDGATSTFGAQGLSKETPPWTLIWGFYNQLYNADSLRDDKGDEIDTRFHLTTYLLVQRIVLTTPFRNRRMQHFVEMIPTFIATDFSVGSISESTAGFADFAIGSGIMFPDLYKNDWLEAELIVDVDFFFPTGHYQYGGLKNLGANAYSYLAAFDFYFHLPQIGNGIYFQPSVYLSGSAKNTDFRNPVTASPNSTYKPGPTVQHFFKVLYHLNSAWSVGLTGYFDFQYHSDRLDGDPIKNSAERSLMMGPLVTGYFERFFFDLFLMQEFGVRNRPEGARFTGVLFFFF